MVKGEILSRATSVQIDSRSRDQSLLLYRLEPCAVIADVIVDGGTWAVADVHVSDQAAAFRKAETTAEICSSVKSADIGSDRQRSQSASVTGKSPRR